MSIFDSSPVVPFLQKNNVIKTPEDSPLMAYCPECGELADFSDAFLMDSDEYQCPECFTDFHVSELVPLDARRILPSELPNGGHIG